jgi:hypothetical protein
MASKLTIDQIQSSTGTLQSQGNFILDNSKTTTESYIPSTFTDNYGSAPAEGSIRYNKSENRVEFFDGSVWRQFVKSTIVKENLVLDLDAADYSGSGDWLDRSGYGNNAVRTGTGYTNADQYSYFSFNGSSDYMTISGSQSLTIYDEITVCYLLSPDQSTHVRPFISQSGVPPWRLLMGQPTGLGSPALMSTVGTLPGSAASAYTTADEAFTVGNVYYFCMTWNGEQIKLFVDGKPQAHRFGYPGLTHGPLNVAANTDIWIGVNFDYSPVRYAAQKAYAVQIYNRALRYDEIEQNYLAMTKLKPGLV